MNFKEKNIHNETCESFGEEWGKFNQINLNFVEAKNRYNEYFKIFPWHKLPKNPIGIDIGCGSGRWDRFVASKVRKLHCVEPAKKAIDVAKKNLISFNNIEFHNCSLNEVDITPESLDFCFSIGVLHHLPNPRSALKKCVELIKPGAPILIYLYYKFDNRSYVFKLIWQLSNISRKIIIKFPPRIKDLICELIAIFIYFPLAKISFLLEKLGFKVDSIPLSYYRNCSFYSMRTDSRDRFGTPLEHRFTRKEIINICEEAGLENTLFSPEPPYWCFVATKKYK